MRGTDDDRLLLRTSGVFLAVALLVGCTQTATRTDDAAPFGDWDPLLLDAARAVEELRGEQFTEAPGLEFADDDRRPRRSFGTPSPPSEGAGRIDDVYRALGLATEDFDAAEARATLAEAVIGRSASYDTMRRLVVLSSPGGMRPDEIPPAVRPVVVHELGHALQVQQRSAEIAAITDPTVRLTMIEGEANWLQYRYLERLDEADRSAWLDARAATMNAVAGVPGIVVAELDQPYELGYAYVAAREVEGGQEALDALFADPPADLGEVLDPFELVERPTSAVAPPDPTLRGDHPALAIGTQSDLSATRVFQMLAAVIAADQALAAARQVGAHSPAVAWIENDRLCLAATVGAGGDATRLRDAFAIWADLLPDDRSVQPAPGGLLVEACDPGPGAVPVPVVDPMDTLRRLVVLIEGEAWAAERGLEPDLGGCLAAAWLAERPEPLGVDFVGVLDELSADDLPAECG